MGVNLGGGGGPPTGAAGGELGGTYPDPTVDDGADDTAVHVDESGEILAVTLKAPVGADVLLMEDTEAGNIKKRVTAQSIADLGGGAVTHASTTGQTTDDHHPQTHDLAGADHNSATAAQFNAKISDATFDDSSASRPPSGSAGGELGGTYPNPTVNDGADATAIHDNESGEILAVTLKVPIGADVLLIEDTENANIKKRVTAQSIADLAPVSDSSALSFDVNQTTHGFAVTEAIFHNGTNWVAAQSDASGTLSTHVVTAVADVDNFSASQAGRVTITTHGLTIGEYYFTSDSVAGAITATEPALFSNPVLFVEDANTVHILPYRPSALTFDSGGAAGLYAKLEDQQTSGTNGGTFTSGDWRTRVLNTEVVDNIGITLSSNQFTLPAGTYRIKASAPAYQPHKHKIRLQNITDVSTTVIGSSEHSGSIVDVQTRTFLNHEFTIASSKTFELQHRSSITQSTDGFGVQSGFGVVEVFATVELIKVA